MASAAAPPGSAHPTTPAPSQSGHATPPAASRSAHAPHPAPRAPAPATSASPPAASSTAPVAAPRARPRGTAFVHVHVDYRGAWLETRDFVNGGPWRRTCPAPCDRIVVVQGMDVRVAAPGMTTSNVFRIDPGRGRAELKVSGGSASSRRLGIVGMAAGVPVTLGGMALYGYGRFAHDTGLRTAGVVTLAVGAVTVLGSLPLLAHGGTKVRDAKGKVIAAVTDGLRF